jgi:hypothetical protein
MTTSRKDAVPKRSLALKDDPMGILEAHMESGKLDRTAEYLSRGRRFADLAIDELTDKCARFASASAADPGNPDKQRLWFDAESEFRLRGQEPPLPPVDAIRALVSHAKKVLNDPRTSAAIDEQLRRLIEILNNPKSQN